MSESGGVPPPPLPVANNQQPPLPTGQMNAGDVAATAQQWMQMYGMYNPQYSQYYYNQFAQYQQQATSSTPTNAPPGFSSSVIPKATDSNAAAWINNQTQFNSPIKFNLNTPGKPRVPNPLQQQQQYQQQQQQQAGNAFANQNNPNAKKKKKKNKNKAQIIMTGQIYNGLGSAGLLASPSLVTTPRPPELPIATPALPAVPAPPRFDLSKPPPPIPIVATATPPPPQSIAISQPQSTTGMATSQLRPQQPPAKKPMPDPFHNPTDTWPDSLNNYVTRCYAKCKTDFDKDQVDICLKGRITAAATKGELWTRDWDHEPIPSVFSERNNIQVKVNQKQQQQTPTTPLSSAVKMQMTVNNSLSSSNKSELNWRSGGNGSRSRSPRGNSKKRRSRSRSRSYSPRRKTTRRSSSSGHSSDEDEFRASIYGKKGNKTKSNNNGNNTSNKKTPQLTKKQQKLAAKKAAFYRENGMIGGDVDGDSERLQQRAARFTEGSAGRNGVGGGGGARPVLQVAENPFNRKKRLQAVSANRLFVDDNADNNFDCIDFHIVGTSRDLEKSFLRLTKAPAPHEVRPEDVLTHSLQKVKSKWVEKQDYHYACDQLKSIRQDLTVSSLSF